MKLSILICTVPEPWSYNKLCRLNAILDPQIEPRKTIVEKIINDRPRTLPTGTKRNLLINDSVGEYFTFVDCDDVVPDNYVETLLSALESNPDVVTFKGRMTTDGNHHTRFIIKLGSEYVERGGMYLRWPNHLSCMKRELVQAVKFPDIWKMEDYYWSKTIHDRKLLKTEVHLDQDMYHYDFIDPLKRR